jgi:hypothetical protein
MVERRKRGDVREDSDCHIEGAGCVSQAMSQVHTVRTSGTQAPCTAALSALPRTVLPMSVCCSCVGVL